MKVDILGTEYEIIILSEEDFPKLKAMNAGGLAELYDKKLILNKNNTSPTETTYDNLKAYSDKVIRHEIVHAFFHESGLMDYCQDEQLVDWIALQMPKLKKAMEETACI